MKNLGDFKAGDVLYGKFTTYQPSTGAPFSLSGGSGPALRVYKDNSTTESTSGVTLTTDFDGIPGLNHFTIDTSANGTFYSEGSSFDIVIASGTVDNVSVAGACVASFTLKRTALAAAQAVWDEILTGATHNITNSAGRRLRSVRSALLVGTLQAGSTATTAVLPSTASATTNIYRGNILSITNGTGAGATRFIVQYDGTTKVAVLDRDWVVTPDATSEFEIVGADTLPVTHQGQAQSGSTSSTIVLASTASSVDDLYTGDSVVITGGTGRSQTRLITDYNGTTKVATVTPAWVTTPDNTSSYQVLPVGQVVVQSLAGTVQADLVDAVWDEPLAGHATAGTAGKALTDSAAGAIDATAVRAAVGLASANLDTQLSGIQTDTNDIQTLLGTLAGYVDTEVAAIKAQTDKLTFNASNAVKANITHVIDDAVQQNGSTTTNWGGTP